MRLIKSFIFFTALLLTMPLVGQDVDMIPKVSKYLESNGTLKQYKDAYAELLNLVEKQFPKSDRNSNGWLYLERNEQKALNEIRDLLVPIYVNHFNSKELAKMQNFYETEAGMQLVKDKNKLSTKQTKTVEDFFNSKIGLKIKEKQGELSTEIAGVSEYWSRDLYQTAVLLLKEE